MADPDYALPGKVDVILGADVYGALINGRIKFSSVHEPSAISTVFGWIIVGPNGSRTVNRDSARVLHCATQKLSNQLQRFWELEEVCVDIPASPSDHLCKTEFRETHSREKDGRYIVRLPVTSDESVVLGDSRRAALQLLLSTERKFAKDPLVREKYTAFMAEYSHLEHMIQADTLQFNCILSSTSRGF